MPNHDVLTPFIQGLFDDSHSLTTPRLEGFNVLQSKVPELKTLTHDDIQEWTVRVKTLLTQSAAISFSSQFGFPSISLSQYVSFLTDPSQFQLSLNKQSGRHLLFGVAHIQNRRSLLNDIPSPLRKTLLAQKLQWHGLSSKLTEFNAHTLNASVDHDVRIADITDIGRAHSIYRVDLAGPAPRSVVIKKEASTYTVFYHRLLMVLEWPHHPTSSYQDENGEWELSPFLGDSSLDQVLLSPNEIQNPTDLCRQLAAHAALGDVVGRGDRHHENYMVQDGTLYPIDVSFLFWEENESWISTYVEGGLYEVNAIEALHEQCNWTLFREAYCEAMDQIRHHKNEIQSIIRDYFGSKDPQTHQKIAFITTRLTPTYTMDQLSLYESAMDTYRSRIPIKHELQRWGNRHPTQLALHDRLKMYYYANQDRLAAFFLLHHHMTLDDVTRIMRSSPENDI